MSNIKIQPKDDQSLTFPNLIKEFAETILLAMVIFVSINIVTARFKIEGNSMLDSFKTGQHIVVNKLAYRFNTPKKDDVVVFIPTMNTTTSFWENILGRPGQTDYIKRVIGTPGDIVKISDGKLYINENQKDEPYLHEPMIISQTKQWNLAENQYLVLGDNRNYSKDSRMDDIGPITREQILGQVWAVYFPIQDAHIVTQYNIATNK